jgi:transposase
VIIYKRLEAGSFRFPAAAEGQAGVTLRAAELAMLLDGVDWQNAKRSKRYHRPTTATG